MTNEITPKKTALQKAKERAEELAKQAKQAKLKAQRLEAKQRSMEVGAERAKDTRRKILLGGYVLAQARVQNWDIKALHIGQQRLADYLTRPEDRALFGLDQTAPAEPSAG